MKTEPRLIRKFRDTVMACPRCGLAPVQVTSEVPDYPKQFRFECPECVPAGVGLYEFSQAEAALRWNEHARMLPRFELPAWFRPAGQSLCHPTRRDSDGGALLTRGQT